MHSAVFREQRVFGGSDKVYLSVIIMTVQGLGGRLEVIIDIASTRRRRKKCQYLRCDGIHGNRGLIGEWCATGSVSVSGVRVVDDRAGASKVSGDLRRGRDSDKTSITGIAFKRTVIAEEEEKLILLHRSTEGAAEIVENAPRFARRVCLGFKELSGPKR